MTGTKVVLGWGGEKDHNPVLFTAGYLRNMTTTPVFLSINWITFLETCIHFPFPWYSICPLSKENKGIMGMQALSTLGRVDCAKIAWAVWTGEGPS